MACVQLTITHLPIFQVEIVDNILKEEKQMKKRYQQQPHLWPEKQRERVKVLLQVSGTSMNMM